MYLITQVVKDNIFIKKKMTGKIRISTVHEKNAVIFALLRGRNIKVEIFKVNTKPIKATKSELFI